MSSARSFGTGTAKPVTAEDDQASELPCPSFARPETASCEPSGGGRPSSSRPTPAPFIVKKCGYSRKPWRIIDTRTPQPYTHARGHQPEGQEIWVMETLALADGRVTVPGPLAFDRKRDAVAQLATLLACGDLKP